MCHWLILPYDRHLGRQLLHLFVALAVTWRFPLCLLSGRWIQASAFLVPLESTWVGWLSVHKLLLWEVLKMIWALWESLLASCWFVTGHLVRFKPHSDYNWHSLKKTTPCTHPPLSIANVMCVVAAKTAAPPTNCLPSIRNHPSTERPGKFLVDPAKSANIQRCPYGA